MVTKHKVYTRLQIHVTHACNFTCESCVHFSNHGHSGHLSPEDADHQMGLWSPRLDPRCFVLMGGEPTTNPKLIEIVEVAGRHFPNKKIELTTNGYFLDRFPDLGKAMGAANARKIKVSQHSDEPEYLERFHRAVELARSWSRKYGVRVFVEDFRSRKQKPWTRRYHGYGSAMMPFTDGDPESSWKICPSKWCIQIHETKLWKCPVLAYLPMQAEKFKLSSAWDLGLSYQALAPGCSDSELLEFCNRKSETYCGLCPATPRPFQHASPLISARELLRRQAM